MTADRRRITTVDGAPGPSEAAAGAASQDHLDDGRDTADLGILFVHGIGVHERGTTLDHMGASFVDYLDDADGPEVRVETAEDGITLDHGHAGRWRLVEANWDEDLELPTFRQTLVWLVLVTPWILQREMIFWRLRDTRD